MWMDGWEKGMWMVKDENKRANKKKNKNCDVWARGGNEGGNTWFSDSFFDILQVSFCLSVSHPHFCTTIKFDFFSARRKKLN